MNQLDPALNRAPDTIHSVYLMGVGGVAMGALAGALKDRGYAVRGSDRPLYPPMSTFLADKGIAVASPFAAANLEPRPDLVIVGNVIRRDNPEVAELARLGLPYLSLPQAVAELFIRDRASLVLAGTHGKTTTTSLVAGGLLAAGKDPGFMIGGLMGADGLNFRDGAGAHFVIEGDEYDTAFFDKRPKFVHYRPKIAALTSLEFDHADIYADLAAVQAAFAMLMASMPADGLLLAWGDDQRVRAMAAKTACPVLFYGQSEGNDWRLASAEPGPAGGMRLALVTPEGRQLAVDTPLIGEHNALNVTVAVAMLTAAGLPPDQAAGVQAAFGGVRRRQQVLGATGGVTVVDDFAHHPTAVRETVSGVARFGLGGWRPVDGRLVAVFEPRSNTSRRNFFQAQYAEAFDAAGRVFLREPADLTGIAEDERFDSRKLAADLASRGVAASAHPDTGDLLAALLDEVRPGDLCLIMSNGGFDGLHRRLLDGLAAREG